MRAILPSLFIKIKIKKRPSFFNESLIGADDEARTRYLHLGKVALYQMSYIRNCRSYYIKEFCKCQDIFYIFLFNCGNIRKFCADIVSKRFGIDAEHSASDPCADKNFVKKGCGFVDNRCKLFFHADG